MTNYIERISAPAIFRVTEPSVQNVLPLFWDEGSTLVAPVSKSGQRNVGFRGVIRSGGDATSAYYVDSTRLQLGECSATVELTTNAEMPNRIKDVQTFQGVALRIGLIDHLPVPSGDLEAAVLAKIYQKIASQQSYFNGMNFVGELRETISMLRHPLSSIKERLVKVISTEKQKISAIRKLRSSVRRRDAFAKMVSGTALEINFGWAPFFSDVKDLSVAIAKTQLRPRPMDRVRAVARATDARQDDFTYTTIDPNWRYGYSFFCNISNRTETTVGTQYVVGLKTDAIVATSALQRLASDFGFTAGNILPVAYELTPWSWLLDYFTNVNSIIEAGCADLHNVAWISKTIRQQTTVTRVCSGFVPPRPENPNWRYVSSSQGPDSSSVGVRTTMSRNKGVLSVPPLMFKNPFGQPVKITNMLAVMEQQRRSVKF